MLLTICRTIIESLDTWVRGLQASNVATYIAHGDVALSVLMTTASTLGAIFMTPLLTKLLAGQLVPVDAYVRAPSLRCWQTPKLAWMICTAALGLIFTLLGRQGKLVAQAQRMPQYVHDAST